jgi:protein-S-isoprenylcysteine O-methyltransferase Ste14
MSGMAWPPAAALVGYGGFLTITLGWRTLEVKRATGDSRWRGPVSRTDAVGESVCVAGCALTLLAPPLAMAGVVRPLRPRWPAAQGVVSVATLGLGTVVAVWAQRHLAEQWRVGIEASDSLVTSGPFARIRNPFYLGWILAAASVVVAVPSAASAAGVALHIAAAEIIVRGVEEPILARAHGPAFSNYVQRTGRFLPRRPPGLTPAGRSAGSRRAQHG